MSLAQVTQMVESGAREWAEQSAWTLSFHQTLPEIFTCPGHLVTLVC